MNKNMNKYYTLMCLLGLSLLSCKGDEFKFPDKLEGEWRIERSERMILYQDGSVEYFEDIKDAGTLSITEANPPAETFKAFTLLYTNFNGESSTINSVLYTDEVSGRVSMSQVLCNSPFNCDIVWTVDTNKKNEQVWSTYGDDSSFFYPPDRYDASDEGSHLKWRITLKRE